MCSTRDDRRRREELVRRNCSNTGILQGATGKHQYINMHESEGRIEIFACFVLLKAQLCEGLLYNSSSRANGRLMTAIIYFHRKLNSLKALAEGKTTSEFHVTETLCNS